MFEITDDAFSNFKIKLEDEYNIFPDNSATGKTYLTKIIRDYCEGRDIPVLCIDYHTSEKDALTKLSDVQSEESIIMIDNCALTLTDNVKEKLLVIPGIKILMLRQVSLMPELIVKRAGCYYIKMINNILTVVRSHTL